MQSQSLSEIHTHTFLLPIFNSYDAEKEYRYRIEDMSVYILQDIILKPQILLYSDDSCRMFVSRARRIHMNNL